MSFREDLAGVLARDPRYSIHAYAFIFEALEFTKAHKRRLARSNDRRKPKATRHVSGRELCEGARMLALSHYGLMAMAVLGQWGIRSTSDMGNIVYNLIASGDLERSPVDDRADFDHVFDFEDAFRRDYVMALDDVA
ncbi:Minf_1886 family protein [Tundrisphaera sp. TA3]|uniref:Minf_1886 family protein n=1 Tax=Tundrisphaera sp. TA3 TaxID=3435775 RepID=UPI003EBEFF32